MASPLDNILRNAAMAHSVRLAQLTAYTQGRINTLLNTLHDRLIGTLTRTDLTAASAEKVASLLDSTNGYISNSYTAIASTLEDSQRGAILAERQLISGAVNAGLGVDIMNATMPIDKLASLVNNSLIEKSPAADWWDGQAADLAKRFEDQVRLGIASNETTGQIISRLRGEGDVGDVMALSRANAAALTQTAISQSSNDGRMEMFKANADILDGFEQLSTLDDHTTEICQEYDGAQWDLDGNPLSDDDPPFDDGPPRHWNCRSTLIPIVKPLAELGIDNPDIEEGERASMDGPVSDSLTFNDWLAQKDEGFQDSLLGRGAAQLFRDGRAAASELLSNVAPLSPEEFVAEATTPRITSYIDPAIPAERAAELRSTINAIDVQAHDVLAEWNQSVSVHNRVADVAKPAWGDRPRGWSPGTTWENVGGVYFSGDRTAYVGLETRGVFIGSYQDAWVARDPKMVSGILRHEVGHALDDSLGSHYMIINNGRTAPFTSSATWKNAWDADMAAVSKLSPELQSRIGYYMERAGDQGPSEVFAELFAHQQGGAATSLHGINLHNIFSHSAEVLEKLAAKGWRNGT